ncbi:MAG: serine hydrolase, partial [Candidatus Korarchaeota archaeon]|nr:serine hydrolase [Candidatus Korarchaeota archaeon]
GWSISTDFFGYRLVGHGGNIAVSSAYVAFLPEAGIGVAALANTGKTQVLRRIALAALALALGRSPEELPGWREEELLEKLTGIYESRAGIVRARVTRAGGALVVEERTQLSRRTMVLVPEKLDPRNPVFHIPTPEGRQYVDFIVEDGRIVLLLERYRLEKVAELREAWGP